MTDESLRVKAKTRSALSALQDKSKYECVSLLSADEDRCPCPSNPLQVVVSAAKHHHSIDDDSISVSLDSAPSKPRSKSVGSVGEIANFSNDLEAATTTATGNGDKPTPKTSYVAPSTVAFWLSMWFVQNIGVTFWNKKALTAIRLPITLTFVHMVCNTLGACLYIYAYRGVDRKPLKPGQQSLMVYFSLIFVSNIITGNMSLGLVSITFNQVMRALVPGVVVILSMLILGKSYSTQRKASLLPVAYGVYLTCTGDNTYTMFGLLITIVAVIFAGLKAVLSNKFLSGDLKLHPVDLILHQAPLSALWCLLAMVMSGEWHTLMRHWDEIPTLCVWYLITGVISFLLNVTSFQANKVTSPVTLCVCGNVKQIMVITMSILINHDVVTTQKMVGISLVTLGGVAYAVVSNREMNKATVTALPRPVVAA